MKPKLNKKWLRGEIENPIETDFDTLKVYKEKGKIVISKKSNFLGVVYLETPEEIRKVGAYLYRLLISEDMKEYGYKKPNTKTR